MTIRLTRRSFNGMALAQLAASIAMPAAAKPSTRVGRHPFLLTGEWDHRLDTQTVFLVREGRIAWRHSVPMTNPDGSGNELGDASLLADGNVLFAYKSAAALVTPDHRIVWHLAARSNAEIHTLQPVDGNRIMVVENGDPARLMIINTSTGAIENELHLPVPHPEKPHIQFRRVRITPSGTYLAGHLDDHKVVEYDKGGTPIWTFNINRPWGVQRLTNGNTLISCYTDDTQTQVIEVTPAGETVWRFSQADVPDTPCYQFQGVKRLANGNTVICNWCAGDVQDTSKWRDTVQAFEVTPSKKVVWTLSAWDAPDLGTASSIQLLDQPGGYGVGA